MDGWLCVTSTRRPLRRWPGATTPSTRRAAHPLVADVLADVPARQEHLLAVVLVFGSPGATITPSWGRVS
jgi:hypothetical protein